ncbi:MAG: cytochrome c family protein [Bacteroidetes bacterium]|nr:cytochrome c family protein [Bacteroidota bacterium]
MKKLSTIILVLAFVVSTYGFNKKIDDKKFGYIGSAKCGMCHKKDDDGAQLKIWEASAHAKAYKNFVAKDAANAKNESCLKCHATGAGSDPKLNDAKFSIEDGVQCEACHGAGSEYKSMKVMKDQKASIEAGLIVFADDKAIETQCLTCHDNKNKPEKHVKGDFKFEEMYKKIKHNKPAK